MFGYLSIIKPDFRIISNPEWNALFIQNDGVIYLLSDLKYFHALNDIRPGLQDLMFM